MSAVEETRAVDVVGKDTHAGGGQPSAVGGVHPARALTDQILAVLRRGALVLPRGPRPGQPWTPRTEAEAHLLKEGRRLDRARQQLLAEVGRLRHALGTAQLAVQGRRETTGCPLPARQLDVLLGAARGETSAETAERLGIAFDTVRNHRHAVIARLGVRNIMHAVAIAAAAGWITPDQIGGGGSR